MVTSRALGDVSAELVSSLARLLAAARRARGTRARTRALSCRMQAVFTVVWFHQRRRIPLSGTGRGICQPTSSRSLADAVGVLPRPGSGPARRAGAGR